MCSLFLVARKITDGINRALVAASHAHGLLHGMDVFAEGGSVVDLFHSALAQRLGVDAPAVTNIVQRLEQSGLVERMRDREDQRIVKVSLSEEGQEIMRSLQRQTFIEELQRFVARVSTLVPVSVGRFGFIREHL